jgi:S1-C subfamily serine protease
VSEPKGPASAPAPLQELLAWLRPGGWPSVLVAGVTGSLVAIAATLGLQGLVSEVSAPRVQLGSTAVTINDSTAAATVAQKAAPATVSILTQDPASPGASGFVVSPDGYIVTNISVVSGASRLLVLLNGDARRRDAHVVDYDCQMGFAVLKVDQQSNLSTLSWGDSSTLQSGQTVILVGGAQPSRSTVTRGVVSALNQQLTVLSSAADGGAVQLSGLIQTDAAFPQVLNGGPLLNAGGDVMGVLTQAETVQHQQVSFALPANSIQAEVGELVQHQRLLVPSLGVRSSEVTADQAAVEGGLEGSKITSVTPGGPAEKAGLKAGDVLTRIDNQTIGAANPLPQLLRSHFRAGQRVTLTYARGNTSTQVQVAIGEARPAC